VTLSSALRNLEADGRAVEVYLFDGGISEDSRARLRRVTREAYVGEVSLKWVRPDMSTVNDLPTRDWINASSYLRLLIPEHVPEHTERVLYLDSDLLVEGNLARLWDEPMAGSALLAVQAYGTPYVSSSLGIRKHEALGLPPETPYFNAGVLMLDQEGLNAVLAGDWKALDLRWNVMSHVLFFEEWPASPFKERVRREREQLLAEPYVWHFAGGSKPWQIGCVHPAQLRWMRYLRESGWYHATEQLHRLGLWYLRYAWWRVKRTARLIS
jgi:lipopolysaccharide biosynthesis glycosyltransferase